MTFAAWRSSNFCTLPVEFLAAPERITALGRFEPCKGFCGQSDQMLAFVAPLHGFKLVKRKGTSPHLIIRLRHHC